MITSYRLLTTAAFLLLSSVITFTDAFGLVNTPIKPLLTLSPSFAVLRPTRHSSALCAEGGEASKEEVEEETEQEATAESNADSSSDTDEEEEQVQEATDDVKEDEVDSEVKALKDQISQMESTLKQKNRDLSKLQDLAEDYSEGGYARKVAEMEGYRRSKSAASKNRGLVARAVVLESFLPVLEDLQSKAEVYADDEFAKKYSALGSDFNNALKNLGVSEFTVSESEKIDVMRINTVKEEYSDTVAKGCVITSLRVGYELEGNVMRMADAVVSLGSEADAKTSEAEDEPEDGKVEDEDGETTADGEK